MIQTIIKPKKTAFNMTVSMPLEYLGKDVHVLFYIDEEVKNTTVTELPNKKKASDFIGSLSKKEGEKMQKYITKSRNEWERNFLIDTNVIIDLQMNTLPESALKFLTDLIDIDFTISFITYIEFLGYKNVSKQSQDFISIATVLQINTEIINNCIEIRKTNKIKLPDAIIAATALANNLTLITRNAKDFEKIHKLKIVNPYSL